MHSPQNQTDAIGGAVIAARPHPGKWKEKVAKT
jgi:hypothetical protein